MFIIYIISVVSVFLVLHSMLNLTYKFKDENNGSFKIKIPLFLYILGIFFAFAPVVNTLIFVVYTFSILSFCYTEKPYYIKNVRQDTGRIIPCGYLKIVYKLGKFLSKGI